MLKVERVSTGYGPLEVLREVSLEARAGEIVAVLGANGAGKTTLMRALTGLLATRAGAIWLDGQHVERLAPERRVRLGLALVPEGRDLFGSLTVRENLVMGAFTRRASAEIEAAMARVLAYFPRLKDRLHAQAASLSGGEGQMLAIGRALMSQPRALLLDEPSQGLAPIVVEAVFDVLARLNRDEGLTILLVEQNARKALGIAGRAYVLQSGTVALHGTPRELADTATLRELYLGG
ncbi:MAG: branched-chain amino acid ABC transporter, ATP-binding protein LivF [Ktedonobacterales bacterium]|jgi:branched-chain amino acid transport system ATP-binding protein|nr:MAG: branched-chain amino acid ABC transporter, ATP-binding protein LivF [Ktedonobacterales bacterium]